MSKRISEGERRANFALVHAQANNNMLRVQMLYLIKEAERLTQGLREMLDENASVVADVLEKGTKDA
jgi:hypothetical protein